MIALSRLTPLFARARPRLGLSNDYHQGAARSWEISPACVTQTPGAIFDEADVSRITGVYPGNTIEMEVARARGGAVSHGATTAYEFHDAMLVDGNLFAWRACLTVRGGRAPWIASGKVTEHDAGALASTPLGVRYFGHWLLDDLPLQLAAREIASPVTVLADPTPSQAGYASALGLEAALHDTSFFKRLVVLDDNGHNAHKRARYRVMRSLARQATPANFSGTRGVMILRGQSGTGRVLTNEQEVAALAARRGFRILDPNRCTARQMLEACLDAPVVMGVEGSHLANGLMWMAEGGAMLVIQPPQRFVTVLKSSCDSVGGRYAFVVAQPAANESFHVAIGAVDRMLDRLGV